MSTAVISDIGAMFTELFNIKAPAAHTDLFEEGVLDSLQLVELLAQLEERFDVRIAIEDLQLDELRSVARIARLVSAGSTAPH